MLGFNRVANLKYASIEAVIAAIGVLTSDNTNPAQGDTVTINGHVYTFATTVAGVAATGVLTSNNTNVSDGDTVTIGTTVYRFKTTIAQIGDIHIGASADASLTNLAAAINGTGTPGTDYFTGTPTDPNVSSSAVSAHALTLTDLAVGSAGNSVATTTTATTLSWGHTTLTGGIDIINSVLIGAAADNSLTNLAAAINGTAGAGTTYGTGTPVNTDVTSGAVASHKITVTAITAGAAQNNLATTAASSHLSWGDATLDGGSGGLMKDYFVDNTSAINTDAMDVQAYNEAIAFIKVYSHAGTNPTLDCKIQYSHNYDPQTKIGDWVDSGDAFTQITTSNAVTFKKLSANFGKYIRFVVTPGGTTPQYEIDLALMGKL